MKNVGSILLFAMCILFIFTLTLFAEEIKYDFRKTNWGMSEDQVKASERGKIIDFNQNGFSYKDNIAGLDCIIIYQFVENKLYLAEYVFIGEHINQNLWLEDYQNLREILVRKYGEPTKNSESWANDAKREQYNDQKNLGNAIGIGYLAYYVEWNTPETKIWISLKGDNFDIYLSITYESKELIEWAQKILEKEAAKNF